MPEEEIIKELDSMCSEISPSSVFLDIRQYENEHNNKVKISNGRFIDQFELEYETITELFHGINYIDKKNWPKHRSIQYILLVENLKSLYSSFDRLVKGFYEDSFILARSDYEAFIKTIFISCYPEDPYAFITNRKDKNGIKFNLTNFLKQDLQLKWTDYSIFSSYSHANQYPVLIRAVEIEKEGQKEAIALYFKFDQKLFELGINQLKFLLYINLKIITTFFVSNHKDTLIEKMFEKAKRLLYLNEQGMLLHPKNYWPMVYEDTNNIFKMMKKAEQGENWKEAWKNIKI